MSGHSKWATIKRKKGKADAERGRLFTKFIKEITMAARQGGGDQNGNPRLRQAVLTAKASNMPASNIERAIKKGTGELPGVRYEEVSYEGYGPSGVAVLVEGSTDNRNRTASEIRHIFSKHGGSLGEAGCVAWMFQEKGVITVDKKAIAEDLLFELALDAGAEDVSAEEDAFEITTLPPAFDGVLEALHKKNVATLSAEKRKIPQTTVMLGEGDARHVLKLLEILEDHDDVEQVSANFDIPENIMAKLSESAA
jgi:YebC/PmpR family DNA-binding regulatory protein